MKKSRLLRMILAAMFIAIGYLLPFLTMQIPQIGSMLSPMHIPVLLCGFVCGWQWGLVVGVVTPLLRSLILGMPPLFPTAVAMCFELAAYGVLTAVLYRALPKKAWAVYAALVLAMLGGRVVWGLVNTLLLSATGKSFTFAAFLAGGFTQALPGIVLHIVLIPPIVFALRRAKLL